MSAALESAAAAPRGAVVQGTALADLARLYDPDVTLALAPVPATAGARRHAAALVASGVRRARAEVDTPDGVPLRGVLARLALDERDDAPAWASYLEEVTEVFASLLGAGSVGVRLVVSDAPHCPRFHVDRVVARGVLTVIGAGTEWLDEEGLDRRRLGHAGGSDDATSGLVRDWRRLERAEPETLAVFKGTAWPDAAERAVVHRSPPADGTRRVVLTFDWLV